MARTNDAILYGGTAFYTVKYDDEEELKKLLINLLQKRQKPMENPS
jgi:methenyltetrahydromethanopterin cyclohydrolase